MDAGEGLLRIGHLLLSGVNTSSHGMQLLLARWTHPVTVIVVNSALNVVHWITWHFVVQSDSADLCSSVFIATEMCIIRVANMVSETLVRREE